MNTTRPNILFILVDQMRYPPFYTANDPLEPLYQILRFQRGDLKDNPYADQLPGFRLLRDHGVSLQNHTVSSMACVPSRAAIMTGQFGARSGVAQTEGLFKVDTDPAFPWLPQDGVPTMGDWFRAAGYETHYFGRWDLSVPPFGNLEPWGFGSWEYSYPSDQRFCIANLGVYRDKGYTDLVNTFLHRKALGMEANFIDSNNRTNASFKQRPWLAVASFVNPHDVGAYPLPWWPLIDPAAAIAQNENPTNYLRPYGAPPKGQLSNPPAYGNYMATYRIPLNPDGFQIDIERVTLPTSWRSDLKNKPDCQYDYSYKFPIAITTLGGQGTVLQAPHPFKMQDDAEEWYKGYLTFYLYLQYLVNLEVSSVLTCLHESGLADNTIVVFTSDHGELGGAHGGQVQKWYNAYQESIHVPAIISSPLINKDREMRIVDAHTAHVDWVPTLLGLAGYSKSEREALGNFIQGHTVYPLAGEDLTPVVTRGAQPVRKGVLFMADDHITAPLDTNYVLDRYRWYVEGTERLIAPDGNPTADKPLRVPGPVVQPNHIQSYFEKPWKLVRYSDPDNATNTQWELYNLGVDKNENHNLLSWNAATGTPMLRSDVVAELGLTLSEAERALLRMRRGLHQALLEAGYNQQTVQAMGLVLDGLSTASCTTRDAEGAGRSTWSDRSSPRIYMR